MKNHQVFVLIKMCKLQKIKPAPPVTPSLVEMVPFITLFCFLFGRHFIFTLSYFTPYHDFLPGAIDFNEQPYQMLFEILGKYNPRLSFSFRLL